MVGDRCGAESDPSASPRSSAPLHDLDDVIVEDLYRRLDAADARIDRLTQSLLQHVNAMNAYMEGEIRRTDRRRRWPLL